MSADNGIYILKTLDGFRVAHLQAIDNIYWWPNCCDHAEIEEVFFDDGLEGGQHYHDKCTNCGTRDVEYERRDKINPLVILDLFKNAKVFETEEDALNEADFIYCNITKYGGGYVEYGIQIINGLEDWEYPKK
jgi:hypothetical protein